MFFRALLLPVFLLISLDLASQNAAFSDVSSEAGISYFGSNYGVSVGDFDNDGYEDIYVSVNDNQPNILFRNKGNLTFENVASPAGVDYSGPTYTSVWGDFNNDGWLDLYLGNRNRPNVLYLNNRDGSFTDISGSANVRDSGGSLSVSLADIDNDGWLDIYIANINDQNVLYRNNGDLTFTNIVQQSGAVDTDIAMGTMFFDYDNDQDQDLYLVHDAKQPNKLYRNLGDGTFEEVGKEANVDFAGFGMGTEFADFNSDGHLDIYISNLYENTLLINNGDGTFNDLSASSGTDDIGMGWGTTILDHNNDGFADIYVANNSYFSPHPNILYQNDDNLAFTDASSTTVLESMYAGYGVASADFNNDGKMDLFLANSGDEGGNQLFINQSNNESNWLKLKLVGIKANKAAIGARVTINAGDLFLIDEVASGTGYASQNSLILHFGLGQNTTIDQVTIQWPGGETDTYSALEINTMHTLTEDAEVITSTEKPINTVAGNVYPNPSSGQVIIPLNQAPRSVAIFDLNGKTVPVEIIDQSDRFIRIEVDPLLPNGYYLIELNFKNELLMKSLILSR